MPVHPGQRVNYDRIAHLYDEPGRDHEHDPNLARFLSERPDLSASTLKILDMGCGTGKQLASNRHLYPDMLMVGLDLFEGMLRQGQKRQANIGWTNANSARTPFKSASFDYITNQFSYPHVLDKPGMMAETYRILKPGGRFVMTNIDPWAMTDWNLYSYFPAARDRDFEDFMPAEAFAEGLKQAGFATPQIVRRTWLMAGTLGQFLDYVLQRYRTSQLMVIPDGDYEAGLAKIRAEIAQSGSESAVDSKLTLIMICADKA